MMKNNTMVIGNRKENVKVEADPILKDSLAGSLSVVPGTSQETIQEPVYENDWGNDHIVLNKLEGKLLEDRRLYARALFMQRIKCNTLFKSMESAPVLLTEPLEFMIIDLSLGGIGIVCKQGIMIGTILFFKLTLDNLVYDIRCEVVYCFQNDDKYRAGLKIVDRDINFIRHLKILVARLSLQSKYGSRT